MEINEEINTPIVENYGSAGNCQTNFSTPLNIVTQDYFNYENSSLQYIVADQLLPTVDDMKELISIKAGLALGVLMNKDRVNVAKSVIELCLKDNKSRRYV